MMTIELMSPLTIVALHRLAACPMLRLTISDFLTTSRRHTIASLFTFSNHLLCYYNLSPSSYSIQRAGPLYTIYVHYLPHLAMPRRLALGYAVSMEIDDTFAQSVAPDFVETAQMTRYQFTASKHFHSSITNID